MKLTSKQIKQIINEELQKVLDEVDRETCAIHSLGFIDLDGNFIDLQKEGGMVHIDWLISKFGRHEAANFGGAPPGWIKVSNAYVMTIKAFSWESIKPKQIDALIEMWMSCAKYSPWIRKKANSKLLEFWSDSGPQEFTLGDFLEIFGSKEQVERFFNFLMNY